MSNSAKFTGEAYVEKGTVPRAVIHKKILDAAESNPDASMEQLSEDISGASLSIVERVLDEYGDPATVETDGNGHTEESELNTDETSLDEGGGFGHSEKGTGESDTKIEREGADPWSTVSPSDLTEKQLETMRVIADRPDATQVELGDILGVTSATINQRINAIDGFDWEKRAEFVDALFSEAPRNSLDADRAPVTDVERSIISRPSPTTDSESTAEETQKTLTRLQRDGGHEPYEEQSSDSEPDPVEESQRQLMRAMVASLETLSDQTTELSRQVESLQSGRCHSPSAPVQADPELTHKIVHACFAADTITEEEELRILKAVLSVEE
jgi:hypothetical protein